MFNFSLYNGSLTTRLFVALTVALCIWSILTMTGNAMEGDENSGGDCYEAVYHEHTGSKSSGGGCYGEAVKHSHTGSPNEGGGCYGQSIFHTHSGNSGQGGGCYGACIYHKHSGDATTGGGCYGTAVYHTHEGNETEGGACFAAPIYHQHQGVAATTSPNGCYTEAVNVNIGKVCGSFYDLGDDTWKCNNCGWVIPDWNVPYDKQHWPQIMETRYMLGCGKTEEMVDSYELSCLSQEGEIEAYSMSCGKSTGTVEGYQLSCGKKESTVEAFGLNCGYSEGQIESYKRTCGMTNETIVGYNPAGDFESTAENDAANQEAEDMQQPVKVPMELEGNLSEDKSPVEEGKLETNLFAENTDWVLESFVTTDKGALESKVGEVPSAEIPETEETISQKRENATVSAENLQLAGFGLSKKEEQGVVMAFLLVAVCMLGVLLYFKKTVALFYYDETNHYHSLGRIRFQRTQKGYHVEIGNGLRKKATTDRYRIRTNKRMQKAAEKQHLYVKISTQIMKLGLEEYVDFAL